MIPSAKAEKSWLTRHGIVPRKRIGQNFLVHPQIASRLVRASGVKKDETVLEVGAGAGALTRALLDHGSRVWAVEVDPRLVSLLHERFDGPIGEGRLQVIEGSILDLSLERLSGGPGNPTCVIGNLPYVITSPVILWALVRHRSFRSAVFLVQKEVADRISASPGGRTYGSITVWIAFHAAARRISTVRPGSFWPTPAVESTLIALDFHPKPPVRVISPGHLEKLLRAVFVTRRKMLRTSLGAALGDRTLAIRMLEEAGIEPTRRAETLSLQEFASLANSFGEIL